MRGSALGGLGELQGVRVAVQAKPDAASLYPAIL